jgi:hypothetical protein
MPERREAARKAYSIWLRVSASQGIQGTSNQYKVHTTREAAQKRCTEKLQYKDRKRTDILKILKLRIMMTYINKYY